MPLSPLGAVPALGLVYSTRVMTELKGELSDFNPRSMLDFGSGPGTAALAVWDVWGMEGGNVVDVDGEEHWEKEGESTLKYCVPNDLHGYSVPHSTIWMHTKYLSYY